MSATTNSADAKYAPFAAALQSSLAAYGLSGAVAPTRMGQPRPPGDRSPHCAALTEVVTESFAELALDPRRDVLLECYTRRCDACKAFAPRLRMLAQLCAQRAPHELLLHHERGGGLGDGAQLRSG